MLRDGRVQTTDLHAHMVGGKCVCEPKWKGPICNEFEGCPEGHALHGKVCTANVCQHGGTLAVGRKEIECICEVGNFRYLDFVDWERQGTVILQRAGGSISQGCNV
ncbi:unnamed protein product [Strongylus vulgaris]|uniref:EGF-like domain-containing protein n=1 Tax=Strongylus vulgaris TaxID=40348 RepID=A0A3P7JAU5_STRVU|nr:unnamed protein product [Strongylus vulgaris]